MVDAAVCADIALARFRDQDACGSKHAHALVQDHLDKTWVGLSDQITGQADCFIARHHVAETPHAPLGLGDDLLCNHHDVTGHQPDPSRYELREVVTWIDLRQAVYAD